MVSAVAMRSRSPLVKVGHRTVNLYRLRVILVGQMLSAAALKRDLGEYLLSAQSPSSTRHDRADSMALSSPVSLARFLSSTTRFRYWQVGRRSWSTRPTSNPWPSWPTVTRRQDGRHLLTRLKKAARCQVETFQSIQPCC